MQSYEHRLSLRSSSSALFPRHHLHVDESTDSIAITRELLHGPRVPERGSSARQSSVLTPNRHSHVEDSVVAANMQSKRAFRSSNTWTSSSAGFSSDHDDIEDRTVFLQEYNQLATKVCDTSNVPEWYTDGEQHCIRNLAKDQDEKAAVRSSLSHRGAIHTDLTKVHHPRHASEKHSSWFSRKILRKTSSTQTLSHIDRQIKSRRSISDLSIRSKTKRDVLKDKELQDLVRLCGSSLLYLPADYAAGSLGIPTCLRATAQYLVQHGESIAKA